MTINYQMSLNKLAKINKLVSIVFSKEMKRMILIMNPKNIKTINFNKQAIINKNGNIKIPTIIVNSIKAKITKITITKNNIKHKKK